MIAFLLSISWSTWAILLALTVMAGLVIYDGWKIDQRMKELDARLKEALGDPDDLDLNGGTFYATRNEYEDARIENIKAASKPMPLEPRKVRAES